MRWLWGLALVGVGIAASCDFNETPATPCDPPSRWPPAADGAAPASNGGAVTYAIDSIELGDRARNSTATSTLAWQSYGFDLDGKVTPQRSSDVCALAPGAPSSIQQDGKGCGGVDNSFGANVLPILASVGGTPSPSESMTNSIRSGLLTMQIRIEGLDMSLPKGLDMSLPDQTGLGAQVFGSLDFDPSKTRLPTFAPNEDWPVRSDRIDGGDAGLVSNERLDAYIVNGTFVGMGSRVTLDVLLASGPDAGFLTIALELPIRQAVVTMDIRGDVAVNGNIAGVIAVTDLVASLQKFAGTVSRSLCGSAFDGIAHLLGECAEILADGTNRSGAPCDAVSIGIGFTAKRIANPTRVTTVPATDPCDAGGD